MRKINVLCIALFVISVLAFGTYTVMEFTNNDKLGPVINMDKEEMIVSIHATEEELLQGVTALDAKDGDVTDSIVIESISEFVDTNVRYVNYAAFDRDNHVSKASRKIIYSDYTSPKFKLEQPLRFSVATNSQDVLGRISVEDCIDGDISDKINFTSASSIMMNVASDYAITLQVSNSAGDTVTLPATFTVYDSVKANMAPQIELKKYLIYVPKGEQKDPKTYLKKITYRGTEYELTDEKGTFGADVAGMTAHERAEYQEARPSVSYDQITINDDVDYGNPGTYEIEYILNDEDGNRGSVRLIVVVEGEENGTTE